MSSPTLLGIPRGEFVRLLVAYLLAHGAILLIGPAVYWDDWTLWRVPSAVVLDSYRQSGAMFNFYGWLHVAMLAGGPWLYHLATLLLMLASGLLLHRILARHAWIAERERFWVVLLYLATPLYAARVAMIDFPYTFSLFFFFAGWALTGRHRIAAIACFLVAFHTQSLLVFYALPMLDLFSRTGEGWLPRALARWAARHLDYLLAPFAWFAVKVAFFKPYGAYAGYNEQFSVANLAFAAREQWMDLLAFRLHLVFLVAGLLVAALLARWLPRAREDAGSTCAGRGLLLAFIAIAAAAFPYWILGHPTVFSDWNSRHQLLLPLGVAALVVALALRLGPSGRMALIGGVLAASLAINWQHYLFYFIDWKKQQALIAFLGSSADVREAQLVVVEDHAPNVFGRRYRFYELNGMLRLSHTQGPVKFGVTTAEVGDYLSGKLDTYFRANWNAEGHQRVTGAPATKVTVTGLFTHDIRAEPFRR